MTTLGRVVHKLRAEALDRRLGDPRGPLTALLFAALALGVYAICHAAGTLAAKRPPLPAQVLVSCDAPTGTDVLVVHVVTSPDERRPHYRYGCRIVHGARPLGNSTSLGGDMIDLKNVQPRSWASRYPSDRQMRFVCPKCGGEYYKPQECDGCPGVQVKRRTKLPGGESR